MRIIDRNVISKSVCMYNIKADVHLNKWSETVEISE